MRKLLPQLLIILLTACVVYPHSSNAQSATDTRDAIANIFAIGQATKAAKLKAQNEALKKIKEIFEGLSNGGSAQDALTNSLSAIDAYPKFSTPYLLAAYASLQLNNPLNANRFLGLYDRVARKRENREINKDVPTSFVEQIRKQTYSEIARYTKADIERLSANDAWLDHSLNLNLDAALRAVFPDDDKYGSNTPSDFNVETHFGLDYSKYFWFNKGKAFSTVGYKNMGIELNAGVDVKVDFINPSLYPGRDQVYFQPGIFLGRWYIAPFRVQFNKLNNYTDAAPSFFYSYTPNGQRFITHTDFSPQATVPILPVPEIRYYTPFLGGYAHDYKKNAKPGFNGYNETYIYLKWNDEIYNGYHSEYGEVFNGEQAEGILGLHFGIGNTSFNWYAGFGSLAANNFSQKGNVYTPENLFNDMFFKSGIGIKIRLF